MRADVAICNDVVFARIMDFLRPPVAELRRLGSVNRRLALAAARSLATHCAEGGPLVALDVWIQEADECLGSFWKALNLGFRALRDHCSACPALVAWELPALNVWLVYTSQLHDVIKVLHCQLQVLLSEYNFSSKLMSWTAAWTHQDGHPAIAHARSLVDDSRQRRISEARVRIHTAQ
eukprot:TRINITY_DN16468_c0_g1_i2.p1 TRINITY_DN16468_c0_g1~~TRINITY_DN16468_c0_g1_i2.p1  ORF type:complete len:178 (+),score=31.42 TRINITY_DN16468_c0_g1_i2:86-619(+)